jgi:hypothetical protein
MYEELIGKKLYWEETDEETGADQSGYYEIRSADKDNCWLYLEDDERDLDVEIQLPTDWVLQLVDTNEENFENWED